MKWVNNASAWLAWSALRLAPVPGHVEGSVIVLGGKTFQVIDECTGVFEMLIFIAAIVSYPASLRKKLLGVLFGVPAIYAFNLLRIVFLALVAVYWVQSFRFFHLYFWQVSMVLVIAVLWLIWLRRIVRP